MAPYLTARTVFVRIILSCITGFAVLYALLTFSKPYLSARFYDFLMKMRSERSENTARNSLFLLIDTENAARPGGAFKGFVDGAHFRAVVDALIEFNADTLIIQTPLLGSSGTDTPDEPELSSDFDREFGIVTDNIRNLFEGIRIGSIEPGKAEEFIEETIRLTAAGKERLLNSIIRTPEEAAALLEKSRAAFGRLYAANDIGLQFSGHTSESGFSRAVPDGDGMVRRIAPIAISAMRDAPQDVSADTVPHVALAAMQEKLGGAAHIVETNRGKALVFNKQADEPEAADAAASPPLSEDAAGALLYLDESGALLFDHPAALHNINSAPVEIFIDYAEANRTLHRLLVDAVSLAQSGKIAPDRHPAFLYEKNAMLYGEILYAPDAETQAAAREAWRDARAGYFAACDSFFSEETENAIKNSYDTLIENEHLNETGNNRLREMRERELEKWYIARDIYTALLRARAELGQKLDGAFCVMGPQNTGNTGLSDAETSIVLAGALSRRQSIRPVDFSRICLWTAPALFTAVLVIAKLPAFSSFMWSGFFSLFALALAGGVFIWKGWWFDPLVPALSIAAGTFISAFMALASMVDMSRRSAQSYHVSIPKTYFKTLLSHDISKNQHAFAALAAVRLPDYPIIESQESADASTKLLFQFTGEARALFFKAGAVLAGAENGTLLFAFGSPVERQSARGKGEMVKPVRRAALFLQEIDFSKIKTAPWSIGLDAGECVFCAGAVSGYTAIGPAAARARLLASLAGHYNTQVLVSKSASEYLEDALLRRVETDENGSELYFELKSAVT
ncbi:MAG: CHASE2 domain-containing protein [Spirochaetaceae bacterium]|jgi:hypothetical protein|nr:CHASE2 domain-containing protein [Spirochaetaceae bacterium]